MIIRCLSIYFDNFTHVNLVRIADGSGYLIILVHPITLDYSVGPKRAYCGCSRVRAIWIFFALDYHSSFLSPFFLEKALYRLKYCLNGPFKPKPTSTNRRADLLSY